MIFDMSSVVINVLCAHNCQSSSRFKHNPVITALKEVIRPTINLLPFILLNLITLTVATPDTSVPADSKQRKDFAACMFCS